MRTSKDGALSSGCILSFVLVAATPLLLYAAVWYFLIHRPDQEAKDLGNVAEGMLAPPGSVFQWEDFQRKNIFNDTPWYRRVYAVALEREDVVQFYATELERRGWVPADSRSVGASTWRKGDLEIEVSRGGRVGEDFRFTVQVSDVSGVDE